MAPGLVEAPAPWTDPTDQTIFHDGYKTSGQHEPLYSLIQPYEKFPQKITGPTVWEAQDYKDSPEKWVHVFTPEEVAEIGAAADEFIAKGLPLTGITKALFPMPNFAPRMQELRDVLVNKQGFWLFKGLPVQEWGLQKSATAYMGLGTYIGYFTSQNGRGHVLGHVKDLGEDPTQSDRVRIYRTNARQFFHTDSSDLVGLLCISKSMEGGESDIASTHHIFNCLQREHPDIAKLMTEPVWYQDRKGEVSAGQQPWIRTSPLFLENDDPSSSSAAGSDTPAPRVWCKFDPMNFKSLGRFQSGPDAQIPPLSAAQARAMEVLEGVCKRESLHMVLDPGDIQFLSNSHIFHARTAYRDWAPGSLDEEGGLRPRRHLMRLWLSVPEDEGGWRLPYPDARNKKRGGVQVDDTPPVCPLDAE